MRVRFIGWPTFALVYVTLLAAPFTLMVISIPLPSKGLYAYLRPPFLTSAPVDVSRDRLVFRIAADHGWYLNSKPVSEEDMAATLAAELSRRPLPRVVYLEGDRRLEFRHVVRAMDVIAQAHAETVIVPPVP